MYYKTNLKNKILNKINPWLLNRLSIMILGLRHIKKNSIKYLGNLKIKNLTKLPKNLLIVNYLVIRLLILLLKAMMI